MPSSDTAQDIALPETVVAFWLDAGPDKWFVKDPDLDADIRARFWPTYEAAVAGRLDAWETSPDGALALLILLDQFSRNMFRNDPKTFAADPRARRIADRALEHGFDLAVDPRGRQFFYLPFMHSEDLADQARCVKLYRALGDDYLQKFADDHADIVRRFGRFPHRNAVLGRQTTADEQAFLDGGGFKG
jgi:uncharacterized protein (DUF924 family)